MQRAELALKLKEAVAAEAKARQTAQLRKGKETHVRENSHERSERTDEQLAIKAGVSSNTIRRVERIVTEAAPAVVDAARKGEISINAAFKTVAPKAEPKPAPVAAPTVEPAPIQPTEPPGPPVGRGN